jgi:hypothetical protein
MGIESKPPKVFISYSHNYDRPDYKDRILTLADRLRSDGIDCNIDQHEESPPEGWQRWMQNQIEESDFVLIACSEEYDRRFKGKEIERKGKGATWEGGIIIQELYDNAGRNSKFIPIVLDSDDSKFIPSPLRSATYYSVCTDDGYESLYRRTIGQPKISKPELGKLQRLVPRERKQNFTNRHNTVRKSQAKKIDPVRVAKEKKRSDEINAHIRIVQNSRSNVEEIVESLKRLRVIAKKDAKAIQAVHSLLNPFQKRLSIKIAAVETLGKIAKVDEKSLEVAIKSVEAAIKKLVGTWEESADDSLKRAIIKSLGEIANKNEAAIDKLVCILNREKGSVLIQLLAKSLAKIAVGYLNVIQAMENKIKSSPAKPKVLRDTLVKSLRIIDSGNEVAARYAR